MPLFEGMSLGSEKNAVIIDIGTAYTKCGFSGETGPRGIIPSEVKRPKTSQVVKVNNYSNGEELYGILVDFLHVLYFKHLLVNPKERRVVVCESVLCPSTFRETLAKVLFMHYEVPSILFAPSHLVALFTLGSSSGLVLDAGYTETLVLPVYEGIPIIKAWQAIPLAAQAIHTHLETELLQTCSVTTEQVGSQPLKTIANSLQESTLEDIKVRCCFVTELSRAKRIHAVKQEGGESTDSNKLPAAPPDVNYPLDGGKILHINGRIRESTCEVLFEQDNEEKSVATLILDAIVKCPVDTRRALAENILVMGGTALLPGFKHRLMKELEDLIAKPYYTERLKVRNFKMHTPPGKENYIAWLGGSIFGALEVLANRSLSRDTYLVNSVVPDWSTQLMEAEPQKDEKAAVKR